MIILKQLHDRFECDFDSPIGSFVSKELQATVNGTDSLVNIPYEEQLYQDFKSQSCFLSFYIPKTEFTFQLCLYLTTQCDSAVYEMKNLVKNVMGIDLTRLRFSRRVYIYHEIPMLNDEISNLNNLFKDNDISVQFFNYVYLLAPSYRN